MLVCPIIYYGTYKDYVGLTLCPIIYVWCLHTVYVSMSYNFYMVHAKTMYVCPSISVEGLRIKCMYVLPFIYGTYEDNVCIYYHFCMVPKKTTYVLAFVYAI